MSVRVYNSPNCELKTDQSSYFSLHMPSAYISNDKTCAGYFDVEPQNDGKTPYFDVQKCQPAETPYFDCEPVDTPYFEELKKKSEARINGGVSTVNHNNRINCFDNFISGSISGSSDNDSNSNNSPSINNSNNNVSNNFSSNINNTLIPQITTNGESQSPLCMSFYSSNNTLEWLKTASIHSSLPRSKLLRQPNKPSVRPSLQALTSAAPPAQSFQ